MQVRYSADTVSTWPTSGGAPTDCLGQAVTDGLVTNRFYAKPSTSSGEPELYCEGSGKQAQPLVEGIEKIRVTYWLAGSSSAVDAPAISRERWSYVYAADICGARLSEPDEAQSGLRRLRGCDVVAEDGRTHQAFWRHVTIRNSLAAEARGDA